jgi:hypothetical protein
VAEPHTIAEVPAAPEDQYPLGVAWEPVTERRMVNGDWVRLRAERNGRRVLIDIGCDHPSRPGVVQWHYQIPATPADLMFLIGDLSTAGLLVERETVGAFRRLVGRAAPAAPAEEAPAAAAEAQPEAAAPEPASDTPAEPIAPVLPAPALPTPPRQEWVDPDSVKAA